jgi:hypothetical protein
MVLVIGISFIYTWFRIKSGGLWTVILHNHLFDSRIFTLTSETGNTIILTNLECIASRRMVYYLLLNKRKELKPVSNTV